ncbi:MAG: GspH/FimT family pseudopilin [Thiothrix sp.]|uniref:GspH/FimT family pseudopilin n=1 Tax=Thiothrix sp. TaxID=1032 RepID=UPI002627D6E2|nr:GspH/FimT family pseudopilin [Thiothrix sp.]MDD5391726.1 GspH/FimT family pseudopilin [Thiothrix sp.]
MNNKQQGMTLIELMVTLSVVAIVASVAAPSLSSMMENNRLTALNNQLVSAINYTRGEAVKRNYNAAMCVRNSGGSGCASSGGFDSGWIVFVDCDADGAVDTGNTCDTDGNGTADTPDTILQDTVPSATNVTITSNSSTPRLINYQPSGKVSNGGTLSVITSSSTRYKVTMATTTGRISSCKVGNPHCTAPEDD